jgi:hypothetical protein
MICGVSRHQHYCSLGSVRWSVAMTITVAVLAGLTIGLTIGAVVAGLVLMEHPRRWMVCGPHSLALQNEPSGPGPLARQQVSAHVRLRPQASGLLAKIRKAATPRRPPSQTFRPATPGRYYSGRSEKHCWSRASLSHVSKDRKPPRRARTRKPAVPALSAL